MPSVRKRRPIGRCWRTQDQTSCRLQRIGLKVGRKAMPVLRHRGNSRRLGGLIPPALGRSMTRTSPLF
jgi:hypothetical protein